MKKVFLSLAILAISASGAFAATDNNTTSTCATPTCTAQTECTKSGEKAGTCAKAKKCDKVKKGDKANRADCPNKAFEGLNLTAEQQTKLKELRETLRPNKTKDAKKEVKEKLTAEQRKQMQAEKKAMRQDAEKDGPRLSSDNDSRITPVGRVMRKYRMDELPQFWNVIKGDMSLEGVKSILTPEQYTKFLENKATAKPAHKKTAMRHNGKKAYKNAKAVKRAATEKAAATQANV